MCNRAAEHNVTVFLRAFLCCMLAGKTKHYNVKVVNYSSDGGQSCRKGQQKLSVIQSSGVSAIQGLLKY